MGLSPDQSESWVYSVSKVCSSWYLRHPLVKVVVEHLTKQVRNWKEKYSSNAICELHLVDV